MFAQCGVDEVVERLPTWPWNLWGYRAELDACVGRRLHEGAMECVDRADDIETLIHACLHHR